MTNIKMAFFYTGMGSSKAHAELYYRANGGNWTSTGNTYYNQPVWKYEVVQNPAFDNISNLELGFRWINKQDTIPGNTSFGIDDIFITADLDSLTTNFKIIIDSVNPTIVCPNFPVNIYYHINNPICGDGTAQIQLSDSTGNFTDYTNLGNYQIYNQALNDYQTVNIPANTTPGSCYKVLFIFNYQIYNLSFVTSASYCFKVIQCPNAITTLQAVVITTPDSVCVGSVIDVPFFSKGVFNSGNNYIAELSDSLGNFPANPNVLGTSADNTTYDPSLGSGNGFVAEIISASNQRIPNGCKYYIRVRSTSPASIGLPFGPFCIKNCDIETNNMQDINPVFIHVKYLQQALILQ